MKRIFKIIVTVALLILCANKIGFIVRPTDIDGAYSQIETLHSLPEDSVDVLILGSSHAFRDVNTMVMYDEYGIGAYNYGYHWQKLNTVKMFLQDALDVQTPKIVLIETFFANQVMVNYDMNGEIYYSRFIHNKEAQREFVNTALRKSPDNILAYLFPVVQFHDNWNSLTKESFMKLQKDESYRKNMGFLPIDDVVEVEIPNYKDFHQEDLGKRAVTVLDEIVSICNEKGINIVFFPSPYDGEYKYIDAMKKYAEKNNCDYINLFEKIKEMKLDGKTDFSDVGHLNTSGAIKEGRWLAKYLKENYDLIDMRTIPDNLWEQAKEME